MLGSQINALDPNALSGLKRLSRAGDSPEAIRGAAKQFEGVFLQQLLKSMRATVPQNSLFDSEQTKMFQELNDQQLAQNIAQGRGVGLAEVLFRQLGGNRAASPEAIAAPASDGDAAGVRAPTAGGAAGAASGGGFPLADVPRRAANLSALAALSARLAGQVDAARGKSGDAGAAAAASPLPESGTAAQAKAAGATPAASEVSVPERIRRFVERLLPAARTAAGQLGVPPHFLVAQAALETGWGDAVLRLPDGSSSHNLFNIKAGPNWKGATVERSVTEYVDGQRVTEKARFRAYPSLTAAFEDYARLIGGRERYEAVVGSQQPEQFASALQRGGYATDPRYAKKLVGILQSKGFLAAVAS